MTTTAERCPECAVLRVRLEHAEARARMLLDAKNRWADRARADTPSGDEPAPQVSGVRDDGYCNRMASTPFVCLLAEGHRGACHVLPPKEAKP